MSLSLATLVDVDALAHLAVAAFIATVGLVTSFGTGILALDRIGASRESDDGTPMGWAGALFVAAIIFIGVIALGAWALTQKM